MTIGYNPCMKGRKPVPTNLKLVRGNPGKRPLNEQEPQPALSTPDCPAHLDKVAQAEWGRISAELAAVGLLTQVDRATLAAYCQAWSRWIKAEKHLRSEGEVLERDSGVRYPNPYVAIANKAIEHIHKFSALFGLDPSSRTRIRVPESVQPADDKSRFLYTG